MSARGLPNLRQRQRRLSLLIHPSAMSFSAQLRSGMQQQLPTLYRFGTGLTAVTLKEYSQLNNNQACGLLQTKPWPQMIFQHVLYFHLSNSINARKNMQNSETKKSINELQQLHTKGLLNCFHDDGKRQTRQLDVCLETTQQQIHNTPPLSATSLALFLSLSFAYFQ